MLDELGLVGAIKNFRLNDSILRLEIIAPEPLPKLPAALEVAVYRITSEALHNVVKHARATECEICLDISEHQLTLTITDNGETQPSPFVTGIGLHSMNERAAELSGTLVVQSSKHGGTQVIAQFPIVF
jgi:signal transduction histidine kinase